MSPKVWMTCKLCPEDQDARFEVETDLKGPGAEEYAFHCRLFHEGKAKIEVDRNWRSFFALLRTPDFIKEVIAVIQRGRDDDLGNRPKQIP